MRILLALVISALLSTACASTIPPRRLVSLPFDREAWLKSACGGETAQQSMNACFGQLARQVEGLLESLVRQLAGVFDEKEMRQFQTVQKKWLAYREAQCEFEAPSNQYASILPTIWANCMAGAAWNRIDELKFNLCEGRGMTGDCEASRRYDRPTRERLPNKPLQPTTGAQVGVE